MDTLRWILLILGVVLIVGIYYFGRRTPEKPLVRKEPQLKGLVEEDTEHVAAYDSNTGELNQEGAELNLLEFEALIKENTNKPNDIDSQVEQQRASAEDTAYQSGLVETDLVVINVFSRESWGFTGEALYAALEQEGFEHRDNIFYCKIENKPVISLLNAFEPGTFPATPEGFNSRGIVLILQLSSVPKPLEAFEKMLAMAYNISDQLDGRLCDARRSSFTKQTITHLRDEITQYQLRRS